MKVLNGIIILVAISFIGMAQSLEIKTSLYTINNIKQSYIRDTIYDYNNTLKGPLQITLGVDYISKKNLVYGIQYGYFMTNQNTESKNFGPSLTIASTSQYDAGSKTHFVRLGFGKRYYMQQLALTTQVSIPLSYIYANQYTYSSIQYSANGSDITTITRTFPKEMKAGIWFGQSFAYPIYKKLHIGIEFNYGLDYYSMNDSYTSSEKRVIEQNVVADVKYSYTVKQNKMVSTFVPVLSLKYEISSLGKDEHFHSVN